MTTTSSRGRRARRPAGAGRVAPVGARGVRGRALVALAALGLVTAAGPAAAQLTLGEQRAGTSSGTFLKIGLGARATGLGESFVAVANDPSAIYWNVAGLASILRQEVAFSHVEWPADIRFEHVAWVLPVKRLGGSLGFQFGMLSTEIEETSELQPFGTGRTFVYSDLVAGAAYARRWTDKLLVGVGAKYVREDLGRDVGNPVTSMVLYDIGSIYYLGYGSVRVATSLSNFAPELKPGGAFRSPGADGVFGDPGNPDDPYLRDDETRFYDGFDAPTVFRYGLAFEVLERERTRLTAAFEANQAADNAQVLKAGAEWLWARTLALRTGYNFNADALRFSAGLGLNATFGDWRGTLDYAYTDGGFLGPISRLTLGVRF